MKTSIVSPEAFADTAAAWIVARLVAGSKAQARVSLCLAGGSTPTRVYEKLAAQQYAEQVSWAQVDIYFGDERCVPPEHPDSNFRMANEALLRHLSLAPEHIFRMRGEDADRAAAARAYAERLPERFDVLLLGIGEDGHTASLFPGQDVLFAHERDESHDTEVQRVCPVIGSKPPPARLTITPPVIQAARECLVLIAGAGKRKILHAVQADQATPIQYPVLFAHQGAWLIDSEAAG